MAKTQQMLVQMTESQLLLLLDAVWTAYLYAESEKQERRLNKLYRKMFAAYDYAKAKDGVDG